MGKVLTDKRPTEEREQGYKYLEEEIPGLGNSKFRDHDAWTFLASQG